eukprot:CAMPEP_0170469792 /NCGR_PEP_ID=MMETSP0123-20130129/12500_1 /TAXON_ID=182087 /ORGANISM="Favella ehrenbergii, Strain Fehren 1" /LENGTH=46 /DNA_ID= /DNA_START= /DNA_END= /DNA_ORIENTATION=
MTAIVLGKLDKTDADAEAARIIIDAVQSWDKPMVTAVSVVDGSVGC